MTGSTVLTLRNPDFRTNPSRFIDGVPLLSEGGCPRCSALLELARLLERRMVEQSVEHASVISAYLAAWNARPTRAEPLVELARIHRQREEHALAQLYAQRASELPRPADLLFVDAGVYRWRAKDELSLASYWTGQADRAVRLARELLEDEELPESERERVAGNLRFFNPTPASQ